MRTVIVPIPRAPRPGRWLRFRRLLSLPFRCWPYTLVLAVLAVVAALVAIASCWAPFRCFPKSPISDSEGRIQALRGATTMYRAENPDGACPSTRDLIEGGYLDKDASVTDAWGHPMIISCDRTRITVTSAGPDRAFRTDDDIH